MPKNWVSDFYVVWFFIFLVLHIYSWAIEESGNFHMVLGIVGTGLGLVISGTLAYAFRGE